MAIRSFVDADPNNPPKCTTCNDYGGVYDDETMDGDGQPFMYSCQDCPDVRQALDDYIDKLEMGVLRGAK